MSVQAATKTVKIPGPDHPITIDRNPNRLVVTVAGRVVADTRAALTLREASYPPVQYVPRADVDMALLAAPTTPPIAPTRATAAISAFRPVANARSMPSGPTRTRIPAVGAIKEYVAFYPNRIDAIEERPA